MSLTQHLLNGDGDPNLEGEESGAGLWQAKTALPASGPPCLSCVPVGESHSSGKNSDQLRSARSSLSLCQAFFSWQGFRQAMRFQDCIVNSGGGSCQSWAPRLKPSKALVKGTPSLYFSLLPSQGNKTAGPSSSSLLTSPVDTCALPDPPQGSQSKNLLAFFVPISESPSAAQRGLEPLVALPCPSPWGESQHSALGLPELPKLGAASLVPWTPGCPHSLPPSQSLPVCCVKFTGDPTSPCSSFSPPSACF